MKPLSETLNYLPVQPGFGTSGVRALVADLTDLEVYCLAFGTIRYFEANNLLSADSINQETIQIPVACDLRPSSARLTRACLSAIRDCGYQVEYLGPLPTPALTCYALHRGIASFMITGSHIPLDRNGLKANRCDGEVMKSDEQGIISQVNIVRDTILNDFANQSYFDADGMLKPEHNPPLPALSVAAELHYRQRYAALYDANALTGVRVVFFEYSAVGRDLLPDILRNAGAEVICMGRSDAFFPIDTEAIASQHLEELADLVNKAYLQHGKIDALISTDGDSDRPLVIAVSKKTDKKMMQTDTRSIVLRFISGDMLGLMTSEYLNVDSISVPISSNPVIQDFFKNKSIPVRFTKIGSPYVIESMELAKNKNHHRIVAWEANGGFLTGSELFLETDKAQLSALPTRDAMLPILSVLHASVIKKQTLDQMIEALPAWFGKAGLLDDFPIIVSRRMLNQLSPDPGAQIISVQFDSSHLVLRDKNNQIIAGHLIDNEKAKNLLCVKQIIETVFSQKHKFGKLIKINYLDGIRCYFDNDQIAHIRPSGNAPQLRIYAFARTQKRADEIVVLGTEAQSGLLKKLANLIDTTESPQ